MKTLEGQPVLWKEYHPSDDKWEEHKGVFVGFGVDAKENWGSYTVALVFAGNRVHSVKLNHVKFVNLAESKKPAINAV